MIKFIQNFRGIFRTTVERTASNEPNCMFIEFLPIHQNETVMIKLPGLVCFVGPDELKAAVDWAVAQLPPKDQSKYCGNIESLVHAEVSPRVPLF